MSLCTRIGVAVDCRLDIYSALRLQPNIEFTLRRVLAVFTALAISPPKVNRFG